MDINEDIKHVLGALFQSFEKENETAISGFEGNPAIVEAEEYIRLGNLQGFQHSLLTPMEKLVDGLLARHVPTNEGRFLFKNFRFVERQFRSLVEKYEGSACSADKTRAILKALVAFLTQGKVIEFNYEQEFTYHLPKTIFKTHEQIVTFYLSVRELHYGSSEAYLKALTNVIKTALAAQPAPAEPVKD